MKELNLDKPIFVLYYNVNNCQSSESTTRILDCINDTISYSNITTWLIPVTDRETKMECIYDGVLRNKDKELNELINLINDRIDKISELTSLDDIKQYIRNWRLDDLLNDTSNG